MEVYSRGHVTVDDNFARFGSKSYAINKITSVNVRTHERTRSGWLFMLIGGILLLIFGASAIGGDDRSVGAVLLVFSLAMLAASNFMYRDRISRSYELLLATAAGEVQATRALDPDAIAELREAIEMRMAAA